MYLKREKGEGRLCYENQYRVEGNTSPFFKKKKKEEFLELDIT